MTRAEAYHEAAMRLHIAAGYHYGMARSISKLNMALSTMSGHIGWCMKRSRRCLLRAAFCMRKVAELG